MKRILLIMIFLAAFAPAYPSDFSKFAEKIYAEESKAENVHIVVKKEIIDQYAQEFGNSFIPYIVYGYGDLKAKKMKKNRITYICLLDDELVPFWSHVYLSK